MGDEHFGGNGQHTQPRGADRLGGKPNASKNNRWTAQSATAVPANAANDEYATLTGTMPAVRDITQTGTLLDGIGMAGGDDYEKIESARLLSASEYRLNADLGYISTAHGFATRSGAGRGV